MSAEVSYLVHATEDRDGLAEAVERTLRVSDPEAEELEGHFGNRIIQIRHRVTGEAATILFDGIVSRLEPETRHEIVRSLRTMMDEHRVLYFRLDKQALFKGKLQIGERESVRIRIKPRLFLLKEGAETFYREVLEGRH